MLNNVFMLYRWMWIELSNGQVRDFKNLNGRLRPALFRFSKMAHGEEELGESSLKC